MLPKAPAKMRRHYPLVVKTCQKLLLDLEEGDHYRDLTAHGLLNPPTQMIFMIEAWIATIASTVPGVKKRNLDMIVESIDYLIRCFGESQRHVVIEKFGRDIPSDETIRLLWVGDQNTTFLKDFFTVFIPFVNNFDVNTFSLAADHSDHGYIDQE